MADLSRRRFLAHLGTLAATASILRGRAQAQAGEVTPSGDQLETVSPGQLPSFAARAGSKVEEAYRYAAANGETLQYIPCFCGCKSFGHRHNEDCYVTERHADGRITFTSHGAT